MVNSFKDWLSESEEHHVTAVPLVGFSPHSHDGHAKDLGGTVHNTPGKQRHSLGSYPSLQHTQI